MRILSLQFTSLLLSLLFFSACSNSSSEKETNSKDSLEANTSEESASDNASVKELETAPCNKLTKELIKKSVTIDVEMRSETNEPTKYTGANCAYYWAKGSDEENLDKAVGEMKKAMETGGKGGINLKNMATEYYVMFSVSPQKGNKASFIPKNNMTDEEIEAKAKEAGERSIERMKPEQVKILGGKEEASKIAANSTRKMLTALRDDVVVIEGVGDAAYWNPLGVDDMMQILVGEKVLLLQVYVSDDRQTNIDVATKIAKDLLK